MKTFKVQTGLRLESTNAEKIAVMAKKNKRSFNNQIEVIVQEAIEQYEKKYGKIKVSSEK
jgi:hypothetical protein